LLRGAVGEFGFSPRSRDAHADRDTEEFAHGVFDVSAESGERLGVVRYAGADLHESLVNGVLLMPGAEALQDGVESPAHIGDELVVRTESSKSHPNGVRFEFEPGAAEVEPESFRFLAGSDDHA